MGWYDLCNKYKFFDWIDDHVLYYIWDRPKSVYKTIRHWFYCNWNKEHWRLMKTAFMTYPWDYGYTDTLMECQIDKQIGWFEKHHLVEGWDVDILRPLKWAKYCIHAINNETDLYTYDITEHKITYLGPRLNYGNLERYADLFKCRFSGSATIDDIKRFYLDHPEEYCLLKCRYILHKILLQYSHKWWD